MGGLEDTGVLIQPLNRLVRTHRSESGGLPGFDLAQNLPYLIAVLPPPRIIGSDSGRLPRLLPNNPGRCRDAQPARVLTYREGRCVGLKAPEVLDDQCRIHQLRAHV